MCTVFLLNPLLFNTYNHSYCHVKCFVVPPRAMKGVSPEDFVNDHLTDNTEEKVLGNKMCWFICFYVNEIYV